MTEVLAQLVGIERRFGSVVALDGADLTVRSAEVHALLGANGAGKSTLLNVLGGMLTPDAGTVRIGDQPVSIPSPRAAWEHGIALVHQHFALVPALTALENLALGRGRPVDIRDAAIAAMDRTGLRVPLDESVERLSVGDRQRVEILKALLREPAVLVLDEPTAVLAPPEVEGLFALLRELTGAGTGVVLVGHKLDEVMGVADRVTVLRSGRTVLSEEADAVDVPQLVAAMVGEDRADGVVAAQIGVHGADGRAADGWAADGLPTTGGDAVAFLRGVSVCHGGPPLLDDVSLEVRAGEIVGVAGVEGNGQRELALVLAGRSSPTSGEADLPAGVGFVPQDRSHEGLVADFDLVENSALAFQRDSEHTKGLRIDWPAIRASTDRIISQYSIATPSALVPAGALSGGNQQRLVVAREIEMATDLLVAENPTRGLDVASAAFVHDQIVRLARNGAGVVLISTDLDEVLALSTRVLVLSRGRITTVASSRPTRTEVGRLMLGAAPDGDDG